MLLAQGGDTDPDSFSTFNPFEDTEIRQRFLADRGAGPSTPQVGTTSSSAPQIFTPCVNGLAESYPCNKVDLLAHMPLNALGGSNIKGNDLWGWTDSLTDKEYALVGLSSGTAFVDLSDPFNPVYLGRLPPHSDPSIWGDVKVYADHAFMVSEAVGEGMQIFDLTQLRQVTAPPVTFAETAHYDGFVSAHNIVINEETGFAYAVGTMDDDCNEGLHMVKIQSPLNPSFVGCYADDGYTHDAQCVVYQGPDRNHQGREICVNANEDTVTIVDVENKQSPRQLSRTDYEGVGYTHQGWLTEDHRYYLLGDEIDEVFFGHNTRTYIWDLEDLDNPKLIGSHTGPSGAIDHNLYIRGNLVYQANYQRGLDILDLSQVDQGKLNPVAHFDTYPSSNAAAFNGAWSNYPFFESGLVIVSTIEDGLFVLGPADLPNSPSVALADQAITVINQDVTIDVLSNDHDNDSGRLSISAVSEPSHGTVKSNGLTLVYTPTLNYRGQDTFAYGLSDGQGGFDVAPITITVLPGDAVIKPDPTEVTTQTILPVEASVPVTLNLQLSPQTLSSTTELVYQVLTNSEILTELLSGYIITAYAFQLVGYERGQQQMTVTLGLPLTITLNYDDQVVADFNEDGLELRFWDEVEQRWSDEGIIVLDHRPAENRLIVALTHLTDFALFSRMTTRLYLPVLLKE